MRCMVDYVEIVPLEILYGVVRKPRRVMPREEAWRWWLIKFKESLPPGLDKLVFQGYVDGYLVAVIGIFDDKLTTVSLDLYGDGSFEIVLSPQYLYDLNMFNPNCELAYLTKWDEANNQYVAVMTPCEWLRFEGNFKFKIANPNLAKTVKPGVYVWLYARRLERKS